MTTVIVVVLVVLLLVAALRLWMTANRLDRLHVRTEAAWSALEGALARRIVATRAVAAAGGLDHPQSDQLRRLADVADHADRAHRADAENDLSRALSTIPAASEPELAAELADAGERVVLARRFYNDAVRDTRALRAVLFTRVFGLAGRAAMPDYFEIAEYPQRSGPLTPHRRQGGAARRRRPGAAALRHRPAGGFALVDHPGRRRRGRRDVARRGPARTGRGDRPAARCGRSGRPDLAPGGPVHLHRHRLRADRVLFRRPRTPTAGRSPSDPDVRRPDIQRGRRWSPDAGVDGAPSGTTMVAAPLVAAASDAAGSGVPVRRGRDRTPPGTPLLERQTLTGHQWWTAESLAGTDRNDLPGRAFRPAARRCSRPCDRRRAAAVVPDDRTDPYLCRLSRRHRPDCGRRPDISVSATNRCRHGGSAASPSIPGPSVIEPLAAPGPGCARLGGTVKRLTRAIGVAGRPAVAGRRLFVRRGLRGQQLAATSSSAKPSPTPTPDPVADPDPGAGAGPGPPPATAAADRPADRRRPGARARWSRSRSTTPRPGCRSTASPAPTSSTSNRSRAA